MVTLSEQLQKEALEIFGSTFKKGTVQVINEEYLWKVIQWEYNTKSITKKVIESYPEAFFLKSKIPTVEAFNHILSHPSFLCRLKTSEVFLSFLVKLKSSFTLSESDIKTISGNKELRSQYIRNDPNLIRHFDNVTQEELAIFNNKTYFSLKHIKNIRELMLENKDTLKMCIHKEPELLNLLDLSKEEEFNLLLDITKPNRYIGTNFVKSSDIPDESVSEFTLQADHIYTKSLHMKGSENGIATIHVEGNVFLNPEGWYIVPIKLDDSVKELRIIAKEDAKLIICPYAYTIPIGIEACTDLSYGRWALSCNTLVLEKLYLGNVHIKLNAASEVPLVGCYGEVYPDILIELHNSTVNGRADYSQKNYSLKLPTAAGSTKMSGPAKYTYTEPTSTKQEHENQDEVLGW